MTWKLLHERMAFMTEMIQAADTDPQAALDLADKASEVSRLFGDEEGLLLSLRQRWVTMLVREAGPGGLRRPYRRRGQR